MIAKYSLVTVLTQPTSKNCANLVFPVATREPLLNPFAPRENPTRTAAGRPRGVLIGLKTLKTPISRGLPKIQLSGNTTSQNLIPLNEVKGMLAEYEDSASLPYRKTRTGVEQDSSFFKGSVGDFSFDGVIGSGMW